MLNLESGEFLGSTKRKYDAEGVVISEIEYHQRVFEGWHLHKNKHLTLIVNGGNKEQRVANTKALILDLRDNGGGGSEVGPVLESIFLPKNIALLEFKSRTGQVTTQSTVPWLTQKRYGNPLFIIINKKTASAAEALAFALQANKRAIVVGQPSSGAAYMNSWYVVNDDVFVSVSTGAPTLPGTDTSWERRGLQPDHNVAEGDEIEYIVRKVGRN